MPPFDDDTVREILKTARTIAVVGFSATLSRPSHYVAHFLCDRGYRVIGVNPGLAGQMYFGERVVADLSELAGEGVDIVDVFRASENAPEVAAQAVAHLPDLKCLWLQVGVISQEAADIAQNHGVAFVQDRCLKIEYPRLLGSLPLRSRANCDVECVLLPRCRHSPAVADRNDAGRQSENPIPAK